MRTARVNRFAAWIPRRVVRSLLSVFTLSLVSLGTACRTTTVEDYTMPVPTGAAIPVDPHKGQR